MSLASSSGLFYPYLSPAAAARRRAAQEEQESIFKLIFNAPAPHRGAAHTNTRTRAQRVQLRQHVKIYTQKNAKREEEEGAPPRGTAPSLLLAPHTTQGREDRSYYLSLKAASW